MKAPTPILSLEAHNLIAAREILQSPKPYGESALRRACAILMTYGDSLDFQRAALLIYRLDEAAKERQRFKIKRRDLWAVNAFLAVVAVLIWCLAFFLKHSNGGL